VGEKKKPEKTPQQKLEAELKEQDIQLTFGLTVREALGLADFLATAPDPAIQQLALFIAQQLAPYAPRILVVGKNGKVQ
jgi:hypothetical protein